MDFRTILNSDCYRYDESTGLYTDLRDTEAGLQYLYDNGLKLKVTGIIRPNEDTTAPMLSGSIAYTSDLTKYIIEHSKNPMRSLLRRTARTPIFSPVCRSRIPPAAPLMRTSRLPFWNI
ncbi:MAG: hypothetical protein ACLR1R_10590 [Ruminococcus callidus]